MSDKYKAVEIDKAYFITTTVVAWIDLFTRKRYKDIIIDTLKYYQKNQALEIYAWCLMPSHLHLMCSCKTIPLSDLMRSFKTYTSNQLLKSIKNEPESRREWLFTQFEKACSHLSRKQKFKLWQNGYHAKELYSPSFTSEKLNYIHMNPVQDGIVDFPENYLYSSARDYTGEKGELEVIPLLIELSG